MILGTVLPGKPVKTGFGLEYRLKFDVNPDAKSASGDPNGPAIAFASIHHISPGDRVELRYLTGHSFGLWHITRIVR